MWCAGAEGLLGPARLEGGSEGKEGGCAREGRWEVEGGKVGGREGRWEGGRRGREDGREGGMKGGRNERREGGRGGKEREGRKGRAVQFLLISGSQTQPSHGKTIFFSKKLNLYSGSRTVNKPTR